jgi:hypothetical protein
MTCARQSLISLQDTPYYQVVSRCVRRAWLWDVDDYAGRDYSHRKAWVLERLVTLSATFAIDICVALFDFECRVRDPLLLRRRIN